PATSTTCDLSMVTPSTPPPVGGFFVWWSVARTPPSNALGCHISDMILTPMRDPECALLSESPRLVAVTRGAGRSGQLRPGYKPPSTRSRLIQGGGDGGGGVG